MIAHLVRKMIPSKQVQSVACSHCGETTETAAHSVVYCLVCGHSIPVPTHAK
jgi:ribosomal protein S27E